MKTKTFDAFQKAALTQTQEEIERGGANFVTTSPNLNTYNGIYGAYNGNLNSYNGAYSNSSNYNYFYFGHGGHSVFGYVGYGNNYGYRYGW